MSQISASVLVANVPGVRAVSALHALAAVVIVICYGCAGSRKEPDGKTPCRRCGGTGRDPNPG